MPPPNRRFARYAWAVLLYNVGVVLWGAFVRASGSGAGCGKKWPYCDGVLTSASPALKTIIEFIHRSTSGIDLVMAVVLLVWAFRAYPAGHEVRRGSVLSMVFLVVEALLGALLVVLEHVAQDQSAGRAWWLSLHLINTLTLLACMTLTAWWAQGNRPAPLRGNARWLALASVAAVALSGVAGVIAALGDTLFPATSLAASFAQDFNSSSNLFLRLRIWHPAIAAAAGVWLIFYGASVSSRPRLRSALVMLVIIQFAAGALNLLLLAPVWMQLVHLLVADAIWIALVLVCATVPSDSQLDSTQSQPSPPRVERPTPLPAEL
jgi:heme A synthase